MQILTDSFPVSSKSRNQMIDITDKVQSIVAKSGIKNGDVIVYCPHTTAGITINENADPDVVYDLLLTLSELVPADKPAFRHSEGNSDAHCKSSIIGCSKQIIIERRPVSCLAPGRGYTFANLTGLAAEKSMFRQEAIMNEKIRKGIAPNVILLGFVSMLNDLSSEMIMPILPMFIQSLGGGGLAVGVLGGIRDSLSSFLNVFSGYMAGRTGRKKIFVFFGYFTSAVFKLLLAISTRSGMAVALFFA